MVRCLLECSHEKIVHRRVISAKYEKVSMLVYNSYTKGYKPLGTP